MASERFASLLEAHSTLRLIGNTPLVSVSLKRLLPTSDATVFAKAEWMNPGGSIKDRPVLYMLLDAKLSGELTFEKTILDSTSGNAGVSYAMIGSILGNAVEVVMPANASKERQERIRAHGGRLNLTDPLQGYDEALREAHRLFEQNRQRYYMPDQYANESNWRAHYETTAEEILEQTKGELTHFVAGIGTGGAITGIGRRLKEHNANIEIVSIVPDAFPGIEGLKPLDLPEAIVPSILDKSVIDRQVNITVDDAYTHCQELARQGFFVGQSSGAYLKGVVEVAKTAPRAKIVTLFCDIGERYFSTGLWG